MYYHIFEVWDGLNIEYCDGVAVVCAWRGVALMCYHVFEVWDGLNIEYCDGMAVVCALRGVVWH